MIVVKLYIYLQPGRPVVTASSFVIKQERGGEWYLEKRGSRKILARSRNLGNVFDKSRSLVFSWFVFTFFESRNFSPKSLGLGFLTRISASRRVSDFTIRHPLGGELKTHFTAYASLTVLLLSIFGLLWQPIGLVT